jgi:uncharacterized protein (TIGR02001 family)
MNITKRPVLLVGLFVSTFGFMPAALAAEDTPATVSGNIDAAEAESPHSFSADVGIMTDYVFRGISYAKGGGTVQASVSYANTNGLYASIYYTGLDKGALFGNRIDLDFIGGYVHKITPDLFLDVGFLQFYFPENKRAVGGTSPHTTEFNAAITYKWFTLKHSIAASNFFGYNAAALNGSVLEDGSILNGSGNTRGTNYTELNFSYKLPVQDINLALHVGHQAYKNFSAFNYTDYLIGFNKDFSIGSSKGWNAGVNFTTTDADKSLYSYGGYRMSDHKTIGTIKRMF